MFWIRYAARDAQGQLVTQETALAKTPTDVEYPDPRYVDIQSSQDGNIIVTRPMVDDRPRKWIWRNYGPRNAGFMDQWRLLESLETETRRRAVLPNLVEIWEDVSGIGGFNKVHPDGEKVWTKVVVTQAVQRPKSLGYDSVLEFYIMDPAWTSF